MCRDAGLALAGYRSIYHYTAGWMGSDSSKSWSAISHYCVGAGAQATLSFNGNRSAGIGFRGPDSGIARVYLTAASLAKLIRILQR